MGSEIPSPTTWTWDVFESLDFNNGISSNYLSLNWWVCRISEASTVWTHRIPFGWVADNYHPIPAVMATMVQGDHRWSWDHATSSNCTRVNDNQKSTMLTSACRLHIFSGIYLLSVKCQMITVPLTISTWFIALAISTYMVPEADRLLRRLSRAIGQPVVWQATIRLMEQIQLSSWMLQALYNIRIFSINYQRVFSGFVHHSYHPYSKGRQEIMS